MKNLSDCWSRPLDRIGTVSFFLLALGALILTSIGIITVTAPIPDPEFVGTVELLRQNPEEEEYSEEENADCPVDYSDGEHTLTVHYSFKDWEALTSDTYTGYLYRLSNGREVVLANVADTVSLSQAVRNLNADEASPLFAVAMALGMAALGLGIVVFFGHFFSTYEKIWFLTILVLAGAVSLFFPEDSVNGINGIVIMGLYLTDTFLNILCELLISKQSRWNFIVSLFVEIAEILLCVVLAYRFATMVSTLFFWIPCDIISFLNWNRKKDAENDEITRVRTLKGWQEILLVGGIVVWTVGIGYLLTRLEIGTDLFGGNEMLETVVCYLDACASVVGIINGLAILFRFREQWIAWYICAVLEGVMNVLAGQFVLLVLKLGYITNTTYGYVRWTKYIKSHPEVLQEKSIL